MQNSQQAKVITPEEAKKLRYPLPESWKKAAGILKGKRIDGVKYQRQVRKEWDDRMKQLEKLTQKA